MFKSKEYSIRIVQSVNFFFNKELAFQRGQVVGFAKSFMQSLYFLVGEEITFQRGQDVIRPCKEFSIEPKLFVKERVGISKSFMQVQSHQILFGQQGVCFSNRPLYLVVKYNTYSSLVQVQSLNFLWVPMQSFRAYYFLVNKEFVL